jgi:hypothetical protein
MGQQRGERLPEHHLGLFRHAEILWPNYPIRPISYQGESWMLDSTEGV